MCGNFAEKPLKTQGSASEGGRGDHDVELPQLRLALATSRGPASVPRDAANFRGLVLGCIEAKFCKKICV